jgi:glycosyltransferase involved in cell wall biosynthesis
MKAAKKSLLSDELSGPVEYHNGYTNISLVPAQRESMPAHNETLDNVYNHRVGHPRASVVIPTLNEEKNIGWVLDRLPTGLHEVVLVDGRSTDQTIAIATQLRPDIRVVLQTARGKGAALALGLARVTGDIAIMIDADGSMDPAEIPGLLGALMSGADVVKGSRLAAGGGSVDLTPVRKLGNWGLTVLANGLYHRNWRELCYGYAAFWTDVLPLLGVSEIGGTGQSAIASQDVGVSPGQTVRATHIEYGHGFEIEAILFCRSARLGLRVAEVFSFEHERRSGESNLATWRDGWRVLTAILRERRYGLTTDSLDRQQRMYPLIPYIHEARPADLEVASC